MLRIFVSNDRPAALEWVEEENPADADMVDSERDSSCLVNASMDLNHLGLRRRRGGLRLAGAAVDHPCLRRKPMP